MDAAGLTPLAIAMGAAGLAWGVVADRISARWPDHLPDDDDPGHGPDALSAWESDAVPAPIASDTVAAADADASPLPPRPVDWRTAVVAAVGAASLAGVALRFEGPLQIALFGGWVVVLVLLLATDLDQRLLPDVLTLPLIPIALVVGLAGWNPMVAGGMLWPVVAAVAFPAFLFLLSIPFGPESIGIGDLKLLVSVGLTLGLLRTFTGVALGAAFSGVVVIVLLALRVIGRRSYIPYGPFLIIGTLWAALVTP